MNNAVAAMQNHETHAAIFALIAKGGVTRGCRGGRSLGTSHPETPTSPYPEIYEVDDEFNLPVSVALLLLISYILVGSAGYVMLESDWELLDYFYNVFISLSPTALATWCRPGQHDTPDEID
ncbi:GL23973 [Drosophila persimilis]|uniref:GL23973 n=1 Tax=Drosophila persimilis TaxID=7234 RepID=B4G2U9_DROPE|nr:GL23973 [Drosophila persimilis]